MHYTRASIVVVVQQVVERVVAALLHDAVELLRVDLAVAVAVRLVEEGIWRLSIQFRPHSKPTRGPQKWRVE